MLLWSGRQTEDGITVVGKSTAATSCRLAVATDEPLTTPVYSTVAVADANGFVRLTIDGLDPDTAYFYGVEESGVLDATRARFRTLPEEGPQSFTFAVASCSLHNTAGHAIYGAIADHDPLFFGHLGDLHYLDASTDTQSGFRGAYEDAWELQEDLVRTCPYVYTWDDHDWAVGNGDRTSAPAPAAKAVYRQVVPHHDLEDPDGIWHSFKIGRCWFIVTDFRSARDPNTDADSASKTMMGTDQKQWFKDTLVAARDDGAPIIFWLASQVWSAAPGGDLDHWGSFTFERRELADFIKDNNIVGKLVMLCGDAHMLAGDGHGVTSDFATGKGAPIPHFVNAQLDHPQGTIKGTGWPLGPVSSDTGHHFGLVEVTDDGHRATFAWQGISVGADGTETVELSFDSTTPAPAKLRPVKVWDGSEWVPRRIKDDTETQRKAMVSAL